MTAYAIWDRPLSDDVAQVWRVLHAGEKLLELAGHATLADFRSDELLQLGCERLFIAIGQAAARVSESFRREHSQVPWTDMIDLGQRLLNEDIDSTETWMVARGRVRAWMRAIEPLIS